MLKKNNNYKQLLLTYQLPKNTDPKSIIAQLLEDIETNKFNIGKKKSSYTNDGELSVELTGHDIKRENTQAIDSYLMKFSYTNDGELSVELTGHDIKRENIQAIDSYLKEKKMLETPVSEGKQNPKGRQRFSTNNTSKAKRP